MIQIEDLLSVGMYKNFVLYFSILFLISKNTYSSDCASKAVTTSELQICQEQELNDAQELMQKTYHEAEIFHQSNDLMLSSLRTTQEAWEKYVGVFCDAAVVGYRGASLAKGRWISCQVEHVEQRSRDIQNWLMEQDSE